MVPLSPPPLLPLVSSFRASIPLFSYVRADLLVDAPPFFFCVPSPLNTRLLRSFSPVDNGAYYCYCNRWYSNKNPSGGHYDTPMHLTIAALQQYHRSLGLDIEMYHLDSGFWHSSHSDGHCDGVTASNWSASEFHWPHTSGGPIGDGLGSKVWGVPGTKGSISWQMLYMLLAGSKFTAARPGNETAKGNVYATDSGPMGGPWPMQDDSYGGQMVSQVRYDRSHAFWDEVIGYGFRENNLRAMVIDTLQVWFEQFHDRLNNTHRHETWLDGYLGPSGNGGGGGGGASKYRLPVRVDQALPSDHLASALNNWPAIVSARIGGDMDGGDTWTQMASSGAFLSALHIRPIMDVLWTDPVQPDNTEHLAFRDHIEHELVVAVLTAGPVGFGDALPTVPGFRGTNVTRLLLASRADGVILKPAHPALRIDSNPAVWAAATLPAAYGGDPATDRRANSLARLIALGGGSAKSDGSDDEPAMWWYNLLATDTTSSPATGATAITTAALFPTPPPSAAFLVRTFGKLCRHASPATSCLAPFSALQPLDVSTPPCPKAKPALCRSWALHSASPVLPGGCVLVGEESKYVAVSPQRVQASDADAGAASGGTDALRASEIAASRQGFSVVLVGAPGETVPITVVVPASGVAEATTTDLARAAGGTVVIVKIAFDASGKVSLICKDGMCTATSSPTKKLK